MTVNFKSTHILFAEGKKVILPLVIVVASFTSWKKSNVKSTGNQ
jgi:F0F1-type ATP synthase assembly protein I